MSSLSRESWNELATKSGIEEVSGIESEFEFEFDDDDEDEG